MGRYFGTDGVRGLANRELTPEMAFAIGRAHAYLLRQEAEGARVTLCVGRDTRVSGELLQCGYVAGACASGADVVLLGIIPTPAVAWYIKNSPSSGGVVISASHNPFADNGIKLIGGDGYKLSDEREAHLEDLIDGADQLPRPTGAEVGRVYDRHQEILEGYATFLADSVSCSLDNLHIALDCANGASYEVAPIVFTKLGASVKVLNNTPDGCNINTNCGSTHPEGLLEEVSRGRYDLGLAFDGDADRCLACDENGVLRDGDYLLYIFAQWLKKHGRLDNDLLVTTVMANLGLEQALEKAGIKMARTQVGDRYVLAHMLEHGGVVGGEQSGHIIFSQYATTGDGVLTGAMLARIVAEEHRTLSQLSAPVLKQPQVLINVRVRDKKRWQEQPEVVRVKESIEERLRGCGRLLVRPSGTENLLRLMAEGPDQELLHSLLEELRQALNTYWSPEE